MAQLRAKAEEEEELCPPRALQHSPCYSMYAHYAPCCSLFALFGFTSRCRNDVVPSISVLKKFGHMA